MELLRFSYCTEMLTMENYLYNKNAADFIYSMDISIFALSSISFY